MTSALDLLNHPLFALSGRPVFVGSALFAATLLALLVMTLTRLAARAGGAADSERLERILSAQAETAGRLQAMGEMVGARQADLARTLAERLDGMSSHVGRSILETTRSTQASLGVLAERLSRSTVPRGGSPISPETCAAADILSNKQSRGAFGQGRMEAIVMDGLPAGAYSFQATLSNGKRPDCLIVMPNGAPALAIDAKFPLEAWSAFREAEDEAHRLFAAQRLRRDMDVHVKAIAEKYLLPGETQDTAFLFVPSESIFAELHEHFADVVQKAHRARIVIVSPSLLMLSIQVVQAILRDARMRQEAGRIQQGGPPPDRGSRPAGCARRGAEDAFHADRAGHRPDPHLDGEAPEARRTDRGGGTRR